MKFFQKYIRYGKLIVITIIIVIACGVLIGLPAKSEPNTTVSITAQSPTTQLTYSDFTLMIPSLNIEAPIIPDVDGNNQLAYNKALENGVAQLEGSAKPGEGSNIFIFGHSSYYWYRPGNYKEIFAQLPQIKIGDEINVWYNQKEYKYSVRELKTVLPENVEVTQKTSSEQLTLMTCVPIGTDDKRLIVIAKPL